MTPALHESVYIKLYCILVRYLSPSPPLGGKGLKIMRIPTSPLRERGKSCDREKERVYWGETTRGYSREAIVERLRERGKSCDREKERVYWGETTRGYSREAIVERL